MTGYKQMIHEVFKDIETLRKEKATPEFFIYAKDVHTYFANMKHNEHFEIAKNVKVQTTKDFIKAVALYIVGFNDICFSDDYQFIIKM